MSQPRLLELLVELFIMEELRLLARGLDVRWESLRGETVGAKAEALIGHCERRGQRDALIVAAKAERPHRAADFDALRAASTPPPAPPASHPVAPIADPECEARAQRHADRWMTWLILVAIVALVPLGWAIFEWWEIVEPLKEVLALLAVLLITLFRLITHKLPYPWLADLLLDRARDAEGCRERLPLSPDGERGPGGEGAPTSAALSLAEAERAYLARRAADAAAASAKELFINLGGQTRKLPRAPKLDQFFISSPVPRGEARTADAPAKRFENIVAEIDAHPRAILVGKPGSGKTTTLRMLDAHWRAAATPPSNGRWGRRATPAPLDPLPLFVPLKAWTEALPAGLDLSAEAGQAAAAAAFERFVASQCAELAAHLPTIWASGRAWLLLDGLDQIAPEERGAKAVAIMAWMDMREHRKQRLLLSCRQADLDAARLEFDLPRIEIADLRPLSVRGFIRRYVALATETNEREAEASADSLFWRIAGGVEIEKLWGTWRGAGATLDLFWEAEDIPREKPNVYGKTSGSEDNLWRARVRRPEPMFRMARTPYLLRMMVVIFLRDGRLPDNRGALFREFVETLLEEESRERGAGLARYDYGQKRIAVTPTGEALVLALEGLAFAMLDRHATSSDGSNALVSLPRAEVVPAHLSEAQLAQAMGASLLEISGGAVTFSHQLLQEYLAARQMRREIAAGRLSAAALFPAERWWEATTWREASILLAELDPADDAPIRWMGDASPEVTAAAIAQRGGKAAPDTLRWLRERWKPRLDPACEPHPYARTAVGDALATATLDGRMLDDRPGVGLRADGLPDIAWVRLDGGDFPIGGDEGAGNPLKARTVTLPTFWMARYPITNAQWQAFLDDREGYHDERWWTAAGVPRQQPAEPRWREGNHPRETVNWYEAMAFCAWLGHRLRVTIALPTEEQWERAARGPEGRIFPWGGREYQSGYANVDERLGNAGSLYLRRTSPVGIYPQGATPPPESLHELPGNVWEWCRRDNVMSTSAAPLRGGSWDYYPRYARAASRYVYRPTSRSDRGGFRVVSLSSPSAPAVVSDL